MKYYSLKNKKGFTLIEIVVSLAIFTMVALIAVGALLKILDANKKSISLKTTINNMNFAMESMSREMRVGSRYLFTTTPNPVPSGVIENSYTPTSEPQGADDGDDWGIYFNSSKSGVSCQLVYGYRYIKINGRGTIQKAEQTACNENMAFSDLISSDINITNSIAVIDGALQPRFTFWFKGYSGVREREKTDFSLQTTVSQRIK